MYIHIFLNMSSDLNKAVDELFNLVWAKRITLLRSFIKEYKRSEVQKNPSTGNRIEISTPEQLAMLSIIAEIGPGIPVKDISEQLNLPHANITRTLDKLVLKGLILRSRGRTDKRLMTIRLTRDGEKAAVIARKIYDNFYEQLLNKISRKEKSKLIELLTQLAG